METDHQDLTEFYKAIEKECNQFIHRKTNCRSFTIAFGKALEEHLNEVTIHRMLITERFNYLNLMNKDEIANLSVNWVERLERIDQLDEVVYKISKKQHDNQNQLKILRDSYNDWLHFLKKEHKEAREDQIHNLEKELIQLKELFMTDLEMEE